MDLDLSPEEAIVWAMEENQTTKKVAFQVDWIKIDKGIH